MLRESRNRITYARRACVKTSADDEIAQLMKLYWPSATEREIHGAKPLRRALAELLRSGMG
jgi:hypothetical protein